jgi:hypothetical protein
MDMSKLPRRSNTPSPDNEPNQNPPPPQDDPPRDEYGPIMSSAAEAWISIAFGLLLLYWYPNFVRYLLARMRGESFTPFVDQSVSYVGHPVFWSDLAIFLFSLVLIIDGIVLGFLVRPGPVLFALTLTAVATLLNFIYVVATVQYGLAPISALAVVFGIYIALHQWKLFRVLRTGRSAPMT